MEWLILVDSKNNYHLNGQKTNLIPMISCEMYEKRMECSYKTLIIKKAQVEWVE